MAVFFTTYDSFNSEAHNNGGAMKIESVRIENFRSFKDETIPFGDYNCFVGRNGSGKSTVLHSLNVFFRQHKDSKTDLGNLSEDDFHHKDTSNPIRITVSFRDLSSDAESDLSDYVRQGKLVVSSIASFDKATERAEVKQYGSRLGFEEFREYFEADKKGAKVADLKEIFSKLRKKYPDIQAATTKANLALALREYEAARPGECTLMLSEDQFYGATKGSNRLAPHIQWVFVSASKDLPEEAEESRTSALGQLLTRTVRSKINFSDKISELRTRTQIDYQIMLDAEQEALDELSLSLESKLRAWAHPQASARVLWKQDPDKSVRVEEPWAYIQIGERGFAGELARFGHGLQRSYLLTLLQELAVLDTGSEPTLVMGIEEPEIYQHPPQARHLAAVLQELASSGSQVLCCSHSPLFIPGDNFEAIRLIRDKGDPNASICSKVQYKELANEISDAGGKMLTESGMLAKLQPILNPTINEMFFCSNLILVEGLEDLAYLSTYIVLCDRIVDFRKCGCHIVPVGGKSELPKPIAIANQLGIPVYVVCDGDTDKTKEQEIILHKKDNLLVQNLQGLKTVDDWPSKTLISNNLTMWSTSLTEECSSDFGECWNEHKDKACVRYGHAGGLAKNPLAVAYALESAWNEKKESLQLHQLVDRIIEWAKSNQACK